jgi:hypothetical protein
MDIQRKKFDDVKRDLRLGAEPFLRPLNVRREELSTISMVLSVIPPGPFDDIIDQINLQQLVVSYKLFYCPDGCHCGNCPFDDECPYDCDR